MINVLSGGKAVGSQCKFANFFVILEGNLNSDVNTSVSFRTFLSHLKGKFPTGKGGDTAFKMLPDGSFFNAYSTIADSFRLIEEAVSVSGANERPVTVSGSTHRAGTALSGNSKKSTSKHASNAI